MKSSFLARKRLLGCDLWGRRSGPATGRRDLAGSRESSEGIGMTECTSSQRSLSVAVWKVGSSLGVPPSCVPTSSVAGGLWRHLGNGWQHPGSVSGRKVEGGCSGSLHVPRADTPHTPTHTHPHTFKYTQSRRLNVIPTQFHISLYNQSIWMPEGASDLIKSITHGGIWGYCILLVELNMLWHM